MSQHPWPGGGKDPFRSQQTAAREVQQHQMKLHGVLGKKALVSETGVIPSLLQGPRIFMTNAKLHACRSRKYRKNMIEVLL